MALKSELMSLGLPASLSKRLGFDPPANFTAAGSTQTGATVLSANHAVVANTGNNQGVILANAEEKYFVQNVTNSSNALLVYPPVGDSFSGLGTNNSVSVPAGKAVYIEPGGPTGITWGVSN